MRKIGRITAISLVSSAGAVVIGLLWLVSMVILDGLLGVRPQFGIFLVPSILLVAVTMLFVLPIEARKSASTNDTSFAQTIRREASIFRLREGMRSPEMSLDAEELRTESTPNRYQSRGTILQSVLVVHGKSVRSEAESRVAA